MKREKTELEQYWYDLLARWGKSRNKNGPIKRGKIDHFSDQARFRMLRRLGQIGRQDPPFMLTLTLTFTLFFSLTFTFTFMLTFSLTFLLTFSFVPKRSNCIKNRCAKPILRRRLPVWSILRDSSRNRRGPVEGKGPAAGIWNPGPGEGKGPAASIWGSPRVWQFTGIQKQICSPQGGASSLQPPFPRV